MILACDPGLKGAFALMGRSSCDVWPMPTYIARKGAKDRQMLDEPGVLEIITRARCLGAEALIIEHVNGVQGQSASAAFTFGYGVGVITTASRIAGFQIHRVPAVTWKKALKCPVDKQAARAKASELMPKWSHLWPLKSHEGRAEAAMIGYWWLNHAG